MSTVRFGAEFYRPLALTLDDERRFLIINDEITFADPTDFQGVDYPYLKTYIGDVAAQAARIKEETARGLSLDPARLSNFHAHMALLEREAAQETREAPRDIWVTAVKVVGLLLLLAWAGYSFWLFGTNNTKEEGSFAPIPD